MCALWIIRYVTSKCIAIIIVFVCSFVGNVVSKPVLIIGFV